MTMLAQKKLYAELHLQPTASASEIRSAYRRAALLAHPDKGGSTSAFHSIAFAFEVLSCPMSRKLYDYAHAQWLKKCRHTRQSKFAGMPIVKAQNSTATQHGMPFHNKVKRKREPASAASAPKRQRTTTASAGDAQPEDFAADEAVSGGVTDHPAPKGHDTHTAVEHVRVTLQDMAPPERRAAIVDMPTPVRNELMTYMSSQHLPQPSVDAAAESKRNKQKQSGSWSRGTGVRTLKHIHKTSYQAQLRIRHLRMETRAQADLETAISLQMVLVHIRHAIEAAGEDVWNDPAQFRQVFDSVIQGADISHEDLDLSVFIFMRAEEWIGRFATITSPVMSLEDAVAAHSRLLVARHTSWTQLRAEWAQLMLQTQHAQAKRMTQAQAEAVADKARLSFLHHRLKQAVKSAERAINMRHQLEQKALKVHAQLQRQATKENKSVAAAKKRTARKRIEEWAARRRWYARSDLTMEEMMQGAPLHL